MVGGLQPRNDLAVFSDFTGDLQERVLIYRWFSYKTMKVDASSYDLSNN